jgi:cyanophycin synthetase
VKFIETRIYRGPNLYALWPMIRLRVDLGELEDYPTRRLPGFAERLVELIPTLREHTCSYEEPGGFIRRMTEDEGTWLGHVLEHVAIELQCLVGHRVSFGKTRGEGLPRGQYNVVYTYRDEAVGMAAGELARAVICHLLPARRQAHDPAPLDFEARLGELRRLAEARSLGPSTAALVRAAEERGIPWIRLDEDSLLQLGYGRHQRRIRATLTSCTPVTAVEAATDKHLANRLLAAAGIPVPRQALASGPEEAVAAAERLGYPVVVKPRDANHGRGVGIRLTEAAQVRTAWRRAAEAGRAAGDRGVVVEAWQPGSDHRVLVVDGRAVAVAERLPGGVTGNGRRTIAELVEEVNRDPRRGEGHGRPLTRLEIDEQARELMAESGLTPESVLPAGQALALRRTANLSTGGTAIDRTDEIHPDNRRLAERAARTLGLDVAGVDLLSPDISRSYREGGGTPATAATVAIVEVNACPGLRMHLAPSEGQAREVARPILDFLFPRGRPTTIPIAAITGTNGKTTTTRMVGHILTTAGFTVGMATTDGVYLGGEVAATGDMTGPWSAEMVLRDPTVDVAVLETARGGLVRSGLAFRSCNVGAVLNVAPDHLGLGGVRDLDDLARVKQIVAEVAEDICVLNAEDERVARMARVTSADPVYVSLDPAHPRVRRHLRDGGRAVVLGAGVGGGSAGRLLVLEGDDEIPLVDVRRIPATLDGHARHNVQNALFAAAIAHGLGASWEAIRRGLTTFVQDFDRAPGRLNLFDVGAFRVLLDYAHNAPAMEAMVQTVRALPVAGRRIGVLAAPGDRRDEDIRALGRAAAPGFDLVLLREDADLRGRAPGEVAALLRQGLTAAGLAPDCVLPGVLSEPEAVDRALELAEPGDLVAVFGEDLEICHQRIAQFSRRPAETPALARAGR